MKKNKGKGKMAAITAGVLISLYSVLFFSPLSKATFSSLTTDSFLIGGLIILVIASFIMIIGLGLVDLNYHAWFTAITLNLILVAGSCIILTIDHKLGQYNIGAQGVGENLFFEIIFLLLLYAGRHACKVNKQNPFNIVGIIKLYLLVLSVYISVIVSAIVTKAVF